MSDYPILIIVVRAVRKQFFFFFASFLSKLVKFYGIARIFQNSGVPILMQHSVLTYSYLTFKFSLFIGTLSSDGQKFW